MTCPYASAWFSSVLSKAVSAMAVVKTGFNCSKIKFGSFFGSRSIYSSTVVTNAVEYNITKWHKYD